MSKKKIILNFITMVLADARNSHPPPDAKFTESVPSLEQVFSSNLFFCIYILIFIIIIYTQINFVFVFYLEFHHRIYPHYYGANVHAGYNHGYSSNMFSYFNKLPNRPSDHHSRSDSLSKFHKWPLWNLDNSPRVHSTVLHQSPWDSSQSESLENESGNIEDRISPKLDELPWNICGISSDALSSRIIGGQKADAGEFPWIARLGYISITFFFLIQCT